MTRTKSFCITAILAVFLWSTQALAATTAPLSLSTQINTFLNRYPSVVFHGQILNDTGATLFTKSATLPSHPASNMKLLTAATALATLGADSTITTSVYATSTPKNGVINGDLILYGRGDPTLMDTDLDDLASQLEARGITRITGNLIGDESYLTGSLIPPGRSALDLQAYYGAEVSALSVYENLVGITITPGKVGSRPTVRNSIPVNSYVTIVNKATTGSTKAKSTFLIQRGATNNTFTVSGVIPSNFGSSTYYFAVHDPASFAVSLFSDALARHGITVFGNRMTTNTPRATSLRELASHESDPLSEIVIEMNKRSVNLFAELLLRLVGKAYNTGNALTDEARGVIAVQSYLSSIGVSTVGMNMIDGSGLGAGQTVTPQTLTGLITAVADKPYASAFFNSLPLAGIDGTLQHRLASTVGTVQAKTGTIDTVDALSGIVTEASGGKITFSFLTTHAPRSTLGKRVVDGITTLLSNYAQSH